MIAPVCHSIPVVRGGVQPNVVSGLDSTLTISIPVVRGGVQRRWLWAVCCLWNFNSRGAWGSSTGRGEFFNGSKYYFNSRGAWGSSTDPEDPLWSRPEISIPVVRGGVQLNNDDKFQAYREISIPVVRGGVQRQAFILPDLSGFQSLISRIANKPKTNTTQ